MRRPLCHNLIDVLFFAQKKVRWFDFGGRSSSAASGCLSDVRLLFGAGCSWMVPTEKRTCTVSLWLYGPVWLYGCVWLCIAVWPSGNLCV